MSGPRDLRRGAKPYEPVASRAEIVRGRSHFIVDGLTISIHRRGRPVETIHCTSPGETNRHRLRLAGAGLIGINEAAR